MDSTLFAALSKVPAEAAAFAGTAGRGVFGQSVSRQRVASICGVSESRWPQLELVMAAMVRHGLIELCGEAIVFRPEALSQFAELALQLKAVADYIELTKDDNVARLVVTYPRAPSAFANALSASGFGAYGIDDTESTFVELAKTTERRLVFVTPFLDRDGMELFLRLAGTMRENAQAMLLTRRTASLDCIAVAEPFANDLKRYRCEVREFRPHEMETPRETFHAKAILRDSSAAYVGSANLTSTSMSYSLELGSLLFGKSARTVATIVDAMIKCSKPRCW